MFQVCSLAKLKLGGESSLEAIVSVFPGQAEAVCFWSQCNGKVVGVGLGSPCVSKGPQQLKEKWAHVNIEVVDAV